MDLHEEAERLAAEVVEAEGFRSSRVYAAKVGRSRQVEIIFQVAEGEPPRTLEEWDEIRDRLTGALGDDDPNDWITIAFTTRPHPT